MHMGYPCKFGYLMYPEYIKGLSTLSTLVPYAPENLTPEYLRHLGFPSYYGLLRELEYIKHLEYPT